MRMNSVRVGLLAVAMAASSSISLSAGPVAGDSDSRFLTDAELRVRYAGPPSKFIEVEGVTVHLRDEGQGPALLLINGHLGSLQMWDAWMPALIPHFRVIRIDYPPYGLSGPDPSGQYSTERAVALVGHLADQLGLQRFHVGGTSNGALVALFFAIEHPQRVDRLVLSTLPASRPPPRTPSADFAKAAAAARAAAPYQPREFWDAFLRDIIVNDAVVTPALVSRYHDLNNRIGAKAAVDAYIQTQYRLWDTLDVRAYYAKLTRPVLLQWGRDGVVLPEAVGRDVAALLTGAPVTLRQYEGAGHLPMIEQPEATVRDVIRFLDGRTLD